MIADLHWKLIKYLVTNYKVIIIGDDCVELRRIQNISTNTQNQQKDTKQCPNCQTDTYHVDGCHHITCSCGTHWCWVCGIGAENGIAFNSHNIYDHMTHCGGIFPE